MKWCVLSSQDQLQGKLNRAFPSLWFQNLYVGMDQFKKINLNHSFEFQ